VGAEMVHSILELVAGGELTVCWIARSASFVQFGACGADDGGSFVEALGWIAGPRRLRRLRQRVGGILLNMGGIGLYLGLCAANRN
jgi:hypothetical protein